MLGYLAEVSLEAGFFLKKLRTWFNIKLTFQTSIIFFFSKNGSLIVSIMSV